MFTVEQIKAAHSKVKSGTDFPAYIRELKSLGVTHYEAYVTDGHIDYHHGKEHSVTVPPKYAALPISETAKEIEFRQCLSTHQAGQSDFLTFLKNCADCGIEKWAIRMDQMSCTYFDKSGKDVLVEQIPL